MVTIAATAQTFRQEFGDARKPDVVVMATPDHGDYSYHCGETARLRISAQAGGRPLEGVTLRYRTGPEMLLPEGRDSVVFSDGEVLLTLGTLPTPGFLACEYEFMCNGRRYADLVKVGYAPEQITTFTPLPKDFQDFWQRTVAEARAVPLDPEYTPIEDASDTSFVTHLVRLHVGPRKWLRGYLTCPRGEGRYPVVLCPPGAGSQKIYPSDYFPRQGCIYMKIEIHDNDQLLPDAAYDRMRQERCDGYMRRGMASRDTYYYRDVYAGCVRVLDFLCSLPQWDGRNAIVTGGSQGGALTIVTAALNEKATACAPFYPALCDLTGFLHHRAGGWPKFFSGYYKDGRTDVADDVAVETLQYYDVVNFARLLRVPTFMSWGYSDDTCSPTSVWAAWNVITAPKQCDITPSSGHWRFPASWDRCWQWLQSNHL